MRKQPFEGPRSKWVLSSSLASIIPSDMITAVLGHQWGFCIKWGNCSYSWWDDSVYTFIIVVLWFGWAVFGLGEQNTVVELEPKHTQCWYGNANEREFVRCTADYPVVHTQHVLCPCGGNESESSRGRYRTNQCSKVKSKKTLRLQLLLLPAVVLLTATLKAAAGACVSLGIHRWYIQEHNDCIRYTHYVHLCVWWQRHIYKTLLGAFMLL